MNLTLGNLWKSIRGNLVIAFVLLSLFFINILTLYLLNQKVSKEKSEIIRFTQIGQLDRAATWLPELHSALIQGASEEELRGLSRQFFEQDNMFYRVEIYPFLDAERKIPAREPSFAYELEGKPQKLNNLQNCLFTRTFSDIGIVARKDVGLFYVYNATPKNVPRIHLLIQQYRIYAALFVLFSCGLIYLMLRKIVLSLRRVSRGLEAMSDEYIPLLDKPRAAIEAAYNRMAKNARLTQLGVLLNELVGETSKELLQGEDPVVESARRMPPILCDYMNFGRVVLFHRDAGTGQWEWGFGHDVNTGEMGIAETFAERLDLTPLERRNAGQLFSPRELGLTPGAELSFRDHVPCALIPVFHNNRPICHAALWPVSAQLSPEEFLESAESVRGEIEEVFLKIISRRALLDKEKNEVSIHLSTNLGHDMTNIIATGKWDLETLKRGVDMGIVRVHGEPIQQERFNEAVQGLINNSRMLQEVVNIYRAFGFASRPTYEKVDLHALIQNLAHLFELSTSKSVTVGFNFQATRSQWVVEPRMLKLVLFNLLSNSVQAISKMQELGEETTGEVSMETKNTEEGWLGIRILDAGTGFRNEKGKPMTPAELRKIFRYGFTTKRDEARGGLGLSWVWTIITEFHEGQIVPGNRPEGGAEMNILLPPLEHKLPAEGTLPNPDLPMM